MFGLEVLPFHWGEIYGRLRTYRLLQDGEFGSEVARSFDAWLRVEAAKPRRRFIVVAYSLGGLILYNWAARQAVTEPLLQRVAHVITIASPFQFKADVAVQDRQRRVRTDEELAPSARRARADCEKTRTEVAGSASVV